MIRKLISPKIFLKGFSTIILLLSLLNISVASYCYPLIKEYQLHTQAQSLTLSVTTKDQDGIAFVSSYSKVFDELPAQDIRIISETDSLYLVQDKKWYYAITKDRNANVSRLIESGKVMDTFETEYFLIDNAWYRITKSIYEDEIRQIKTELPIDFKVIASNTPYIILKDEQHVYIYARQSNTLEKIAHLDAQTTQFVEGTDYFDYLFDDDTFYSLKFSFSIRKDITHEFLNFGKTSGFTKFEASSYGRTFAFDSKDGTLWVYSKHRLPIKNTNIYVQFHPINAKFLNEQHKFIVYNDQYYNYGYDAVRQGDPIDFSEVVNPQDLEERGAYYSDGIHAYALDYSSIPPAFKKFSPLTADYQYLYHRYYVDNHFLKKRDATARLLADAPIALSTALVQHGNIAFYNHKIILNSQEIEHFLPTTNMQYLGSILHIYQRCSDYNTSPVSLSYTYFFQDATGIYYYRDDIAKKETIKIPNAKQGDYRANHFADLLKLQDLIP